mmetsp:Transcript_42282/g.75720  ORF Transcript_42282/g.75720 Transcript_42282/m.75720 type:complete len:172 (-) Transcript_42282:166-681(-)
MPYDLSKTPWNVWKNSCEAMSKELNADRYRAINRGEPVPNIYTLQAPGEKVELQGMRRHEHMNGKAGEVIGRQADEHGFVLVSVDLDDGETKQMRVQPRCLKPVRHSKDGRARGARLTKFLDQQHLLEPEMAPSVWSSRPPTSGVTSALVTAAGNMMKPVTPRGTTPQGPQ